MGPVNCAGEAVEMMKSKKAVAFTIIAVVFAMILSILFFSQTRYTERDKQEAIETRITTMNDFLNDFYNDADRASYISGYRAFIAMEDYLSDPENENVSGVTSKGFFINPSKTFIEVFMNGTIGGEFSELMANATFNSYREKVNNISKKIDIVFNATVLNASMTQSDPWSVDMKIDFEIFLNDTKGLATWRLTKKVLTNIPIIDLKDPLYTVNIGLPVTVKKYPYTEFIGNYPGFNDTTNFTQFLDQTYFIASNRSPSFVMRFSNELSPSPYGIESMVNIPDIINKEKDKYFDNRSIVDFIYFGTQENTADKCSFGGTPKIYEWVKLDDASLVYPYNELTEVNYTTC